MSARSSSLSLAVLAALALAACDAAPAAVTATTSPAGVPGAPVQAAPLTPAGAPEPLEIAEPSDADDGLQWAAGVVRVDKVSDDGAKLFGTAGGDPAMNGLYTYIAFYLSPAEGWAVYKIGDVLDYTVLSSAPGRVDLELHESTYDEASGTIGDRRRRIIVQWTAGADDSPPTSVTVTPAA